MQSIVLTTSLHLCLLANHLGKSQRCWVQIKDELASIEKEASGIKVASQEALLEFVRLRRVKFMLTHPIFTPSSKTHCTH